MVKSKSATEHFPVQWRSRVVRYGKIKASQITPHPNNPRRHPLLQRQAVAISFNELGQLAPIIINERNGYLVDGEERSWMALDQPGDVELDAIWVDLDEDEHLKALAYLDATGNLARYDLEQLNEIVAGLQIVNPVIEQMMQKIKAGSAAVQYSPDLHEITVNPEPDTDSILRDTWTCPYCALKLGQGEVKG